MKLVSWNVNGIRASWNHGLANYVAEAGSDVYCLQETKVNEPYSPAEEIPGYHAYWSFCESRRGYSGTLCLTRVRPLSVERDPLGAAFDCEGRVITLEFPSLYVVNVYVPNSQRSPERRDYREEWDARLMGHVKGLAHIKPTVVCGDFNVPLTAADVYEENQRAAKEEAGPFTSTEREALEGLIEDGFRDSFRLLHPDAEGAYTWWSNRLNKRGQNRGWRLDYHLVSADLAGRVTAAEIRADVLGSDHCPIELELDLPCQGEATVLPPQGGADPPPKSYDELLALCMSRVPYERINRADPKDIWESIDWGACERRVALMQRSIAEAAESGDRRRIETAQRVLTESLDAKAIAVRHVASAAGGPGVDGIKWTTPADKVKAMLSLTPRGYRAAPSRLLLITSRQGKQRRIHVETYYDRAMQALYALALDPVAEAWSDRKSFSYRRGRAMYDVDAFIRRAFSGPSAPEYVVIGDVHGCYEHISHDWVLRHVPLDKAVLRQFIEAGYVFAGDFHPMDSGIGIGLSLSPIIANMTLDGLQSRIFHALNPEPGEPAYTHPRPHMPATCASACRSLLIRRAPRGLVWCKIARNARRRGFGVAFPIGL